MSDSSISCAYCTISTTAFGLCFNWPTFLELIKLRLSSVLKEEPLKFV